MYTSRKLLEGREITYWKSKYLPENPESEQQLLNHMLVKLLD